MHDHCLKMSSLYLSLTDSTSTSSSFPCPSDISGGQAQWWPSCLYSVWLPMHTATYMPILLIAIVQLLCNQLTGNICKWFCNSVRCPGDPCNYLTCEGPQVLCPNVAMRWMKCKVRGLLWRSNYCYDVLLMFFFHVHFIRQLVFCFSYRLLFCYLYPLDTYFRRWRY